MRLIITENKKYASSIAYAYTNRKLENSETVMIGSELSSFIWCENPILKGGSINPVFERKLLEEINRLKITTVAVALNPTRTASLFTSLLSVKLQEKSIKTERVVLTTLWKKDVIAAFEEAPIDASINKITQATMTIKTRRQITYAITSAVKEIAGEEFQNIDAASLALLALLSLRENLVGEDKYKIKASIRIGDKSLTAWSLYTFSKDEAARLLKTLDQQMVIDKNPYFSDIITAESLFGVFDICNMSDVNLKETVESLYTKRYISCPYTMSEDFPRTINEQGIATLIENCSQITGLIDSIESNNLIAVPRAGKNELHAIMPLMSSANRLKDNELVVYKFIAEKFLTAAQESQKNKALFKDKTKGIPFVVNIPEGLSVTRRNTKNILAVFSYERCGTFSSYKPQELIRGLTLKGLDAADVVFSLLPAAIKTETIFADNLGVHLTQKGRKLLQLLPIGEQEAISLYVYIEEAMQNSKHEGTPQACQQIYAEVLKTLNIWKSKATESERFEQHPAKINPLDVLNEDDNDTASEKDNMLRKPEDDHASTQKASEESPLPETIDEPLKDELSSIDDIPDMFLPPGEEPPEDIAGFAPPNEANEDNTSQEDSTQPAISAEDDNHVITPAIEQSLAITPNPESSEEEHSASNKMEGPSVNEVLYECPYCKATELQQTDSSFKCRSCGKVLPRTMKTKSGTITISEKDIQRLALFRRTSLKPVYKSEEIIDRAYIVITENGKAALTHTSTYTCPYCNSSLKVTEWGYYCENCNFAVPFKIYNKRLKADEIKALINGEKTKVIPGLISKDGEVFDAALKATLTGVKLYKN